jgi:hypothetical protein
MSYYFRFPPSAAVHDCSNGGPDQNRGRSRSQISVPSARVSASSHASEFLDPQQGALTRHFLARWEEAPSGGGLGALLRAAISTDATRERLIEIFQRQLQVAIAAMSGTDGADRRAALIASQFLGLGLTRYVLAPPACVAMEHEVIIAHVGATVQTCLTKRFATVDG